mgnify:CR=1 FL=1
MVRRRKSTEPLPREVEMFLEMLAAERGAARNTLESYQRDLGDFSGFAKSQRMVPALASADLIRKYLKHLDYTGMSPRTQARRLSALRQFFRFLYAERLRDDEIGRAHV